MIDWSDPLWYIRAMTQDPSQESVGPARRSVADLVARLAELPRPTDIESRDVDPLPEQPGS